MNKTVSFLVSFVIMLFMAFMANDWEVPKLKDADFTPMLIYWYMIWKLFHDKNKDA